MYQVESLIRNNDIPETPNYGTDPGTETDNPHQDNGNENDKLYLYDKPNCDNGCCEFVPFQRISSHKIVI